MRLIDADALKAKCGKPYWWVWASDIDLAPTIEPMKWIPCSERLPEDGRYLCDYGDCIDFGSMANGEWYVSGAVAWMPLPEPWKGADE